MSAINVIQPVSDINECDTEELSQILKEAVNLLNDFINLAEESEKLPLLQELNTLLSEIGYLKRVFRDLIEASIAAKIVPRDENTKRIFEIVNDLQILGLDKFDIEKENEKRLEIPQFVKIMIGTTRKVNAERAKVYQKEINEIKPRLIEETEKLSNSVVVQYIPENYRYPLVLSTMLKYLKNDTAQNWRGCVDRFGGQQSTRAIHRERLIISNQTKRNMTAAAIFSGIAAFNT